MSVLETQKLIVCTCFCSTKSMVDLWARKVFTLTIYIIVLHDFHKTTVDNDGDKRPM